MTARRLNFHHPMTPKEKLASLVEWMPDDLSPFDMYGKGEMIQAFETEIAALFGKEAAVFMPSGTMAQPIALRWWCDQRQSRTVLFHPTSHLAIHEHKAYATLHNLRAVHLGQKDALMTLAEVQAAVAILDEPPGAILIELPQREIGGQLPTWEELVELTDWIRAQGIPLHLDGARVWECAPFYGRPYTEIAGLFDSLYVSFYKTLGGITGAALLGGADLIEESRIWQRRHGGNLPSMYPYVVAAKQGMDLRLPKLAAYVAKAQEICTALKDVPGMVIIPNPPPTNMAHIHLRGEKEALMQAAETVTTEFDLMLFRSVWEGFGHKLPGHLMFELVVGDAALDLDKAEIVAAFQRLTEIIAEQG